MKIIKLVPMALIALFTFNSCSNDDDAQPVNEEEVITTVEVILTPNDGGTPVVLTSSDLDGNGPEAPAIISNGTLRRNITYNGTISLLNVLTNPTENIGIEVLEEGDEHQFFYSAGGGLSGVFTYSDQDVNGNPIGLEFTFTTAANASTGSITAILRHEPNKSASGVAAGDIANAGGETDIEVVFPVTVQ